MKKIWTQTHTRAMAHIFQRFFSGTIRFLVYFLSIWLSQAHLCVCAVEMHRKWIKWKENELNLAIITYYICMSLKVFWLLLLEKSNQSCMLMFVSNRLCQMKRKQEIYSKMNEEKRPFLFHTQFHKRWYAIKLSFFNASLVSIVWLAFQWTETNKQTCESLSWAFRYLSSELVI